MTDALGWRKLFGVLVPSTNTSVQPEFDAMRSPGVTNHVSRIRIPNVAPQQRRGFQRLIELIVAAQDEAADSVLSCEPDQIVLGISAATFWGGAGASRDLKRDLAVRTGLPVCTGAEACLAALAVLSIQRIAVITPYFPVGDRNVVRFFEESGIAVPRIQGLCCASPVAIARVSEETLDATLRAVSGDDIDAIVQVGTNLGVDKPAITHASGHDLLSGPAGGTGALVADLNVEQRPGLRGKMAAR